METKAIEDRISATPLTFSASICVLGYGDILANSISDVLGDGFDVLSCDNTEQFVQITRPQSSIVVCDEVFLSNLPQQTQLNLLSQYPQLKWLVLTHNPDVYGWELPVKDWAKGVHYYTIRKPLNIEALKNKLKRIAIEMQSKETQLNLLRHIQEQTLLLKNQNKALEKLNNSKAHFITRLINKMQLPVRKIDASLRQILRDEQLNEPTKSAVETSYHNVRRLDSTLSNFAVLGQLENDVYDSIKVHTNLDSIVSSVKESIDLVITSKNVDFSLLKQQHLGHIHTDPNLLHHIFSNIMDSLVLQVGEGSSIVWELKLFDTALESVWECKHRKQGEDKAQLDVLTHAGFELAAAKGLLEKLGGKLIYSVHDQQTQVVVHLPTS